MLREFSEDSPGKLLLNAKVTQFLSMYDQNLPTDPIVDQVGFVRQPRFTGVFDATYAIKGRRLMADFYPSNYARRPSFHISVLYRRPKGNVANNPEC